MTRLRVLICYANTGGGHKTAADAVCEALKEVAAKATPPIGLDIAVETVVEESSPINQKFVQLYNFILRKKPQCMKYYTAFIETFKPNQNALAYNLCRTFLMSVYARTKPDIVVSVHPMVNHYMAMARRDSGLEGKTKMVIVLTDPNANLWSGWACKDAEMIIAPNDLAEKQLVKMGIDANLIKTIGMPIEPVFTHPARKSREDVLTDLGLDSDTFTVLLSGGWAGGGDLAGMYEALKNVRKKIQVIVMCGKNKKLHDRMHECVTTALPTVVMGYSDEMSDLFNAGDVLVTKAGGLTTFEAVARRLPMAINVLTEPMPQEMGTITMLTEAGLATPVRHYEDLTAIVEKMERQPNRQVQPLPVVHNLNRVDAVYEIAQTILNLNKVLTAPRV